jgi:hypothetical protein
MCSALRTANIICLRLSGMVSRIINFNTDQIAPFEGQNRLLLLGMAGQSCRLVLWNREAGLPEAIECFQMKQWTQENWHMLLNQSALMGFRDVETRVVIGFERGAPVPASVFTPLVASASLEALFGETADQLFTGADIFPENQVAFAWQMPAALHTLVASHFSICAFRHEASAMVEDRPAQSSALQCIVYDEYAWVVLHKNGMLQMARPVAARFADDFTYQLLNMCTANEMVPAEVDLHLSGFVEPGSHIVKAVERFFPVHISTPPAGNWPSEVPYHYFVQMLRLV